MTARTASAASNAEPDEKELAQGDKGGAVKNNEGGTAKMAQEMTVARGDCAGGVKAAKAPIVVDPALSDNRETEDAAALERPLPGLEWDCFVRESSMTPPHLQHGAASVNWSPSVVTFREGGRGGGHPNP